MMLVIRVLLVDLQLRVDLQSMILGLYLLKTLIMAFDLHQLSISDPMVLLIVGDGNMNMDTLMLWKQDCVP